MSPRLVPVPLRILSAGLVIACALLVAAGQLGPSGCYAAHPNYRAQVDALIDGELALSPAPEALLHDFAWAVGGVHQVWGLGVPAWQVPFELAGRAVGVSPFPDRVPLLVWLALMLSVAIRALWRRDKEPWWISAGCVLIVALLPAFVTLVRGRVGVYEEAAIYAYAAAVMLLAGLLRVRTEPSRWRFIALLAAAGLAGFIRPTAGCYGAATAIVASASWLSARGRRGLVEVAIGGALFVSGGALLYASNAARFGDGLEFGHRLNVQPLPGNIYATRFSYPMQRASIPEAAIELAASLFDRPELRARGSFYQKHLHHGVSNKPRWREYYFTTFSWPYVPALLAGLVLGAFAWRRRWPRRPSDPTESTAPTVDQPPHATDADTRWLFAWALLALIPLVAFYLRAPFFSSRYQIDLAPVFAALLVIAWRASARWMARRHRGPWLASGVLAVLWCLAVAVSRTAKPRSAEPVGREAAARSMAAIRDVVTAERTLTGAYDLADPWLPIHTDLSDQFRRCDAGEHRCLLGVRTAHGGRWHVTETIAGRPVQKHTPPPPLFLNLLRWDLTTGQVPPATYAFVDDPQFVELEVSTLDGKPADWARDVRVAVGLVHLRLTGTAPSARGVTLRFEAKNLPRGLVIAFFAFGPDSELDRPKSRFAVHKIRWR